jgi:hypothetical protein
MGYDIYFYRNEFIPRNEIIQSSVKTINPSNQRTIKESILDLSGWELLDSVLSEITNDEQNEGEIELEHLIGVIQTLMETGKFHYTDEFGLNLIKQLEENDSDQVFYSYSQSY